jgi:hypothetical protein
MSVRHVGLCPAVAGGGNPAALAEKKLAGMAWIADASSLSCAGSNLINPAQLRILKARDTRL